MEAITQRTKAIVSEGKFCAIRSPESCLETVKGWKNVQFDYTTKIAILLNMSPQGILKEEKN